ncbi:MAG: hypothetical protein CO094_11005 [Anaerolineae bacterium CG_4_9_14_3_um_filter_57_17]|nr:hypothetical protein [bacterium]NCT20449.1 hypothetical protein [bacterium]OIO83971.1 MAG: hypothetical protein AUK01_10845 [Anaerolineae bacterium CG2_30_57_67]PJB65081.1 MAG: hypothetical protein CO094_11005 [Anaerolineae bacterium CG_4_9_14_3_um_filter_57_17]
MLKNPLARRALSAALTALALALGLNGLLFPLSPVPPSDYVSAWDAKMSAVSRRLPAGVTQVGYFSEADILPGAPAPDDYIEYYLTQYSLAPRIVQRGAADGWVIVNSAAPQTADWLQSHLPGCRAEKLGGGLTLLECQP